MRIATWNVNSVRQRLDHLQSWLKERQPDIVCLQEIKCTDDAFPREHGDTDQGEQRHPKEDFPSGHPLLLVRGPSNPAPARTSPFSADLAEIDRARRDPSI